MWALDRNLRHLFVEIQNLKVPAIKMHGHRVKENCTSDLWIQCANHLATITLLLSTKSS